MVYHYYLQRLFHKSRRNNTNGIRSNKCWYTFHRATCGRHCTGTGHKRGGILPRAWHLVGYNDLCLFHRNRNRWHFRHNDTADGHKAGR